MYKINCMNPIAQVGLQNFSSEYEITADVEAAEGILVRSASMHEMELPKGLLAVARAGAGVNNIPLEKCAEHGVVVFNTPGANANGVKELVIAGMLLAARDVVGGIEWVKAAKEDADIAKSAEKAKKNFAGTEIRGKKLGVIGLGAIGVKVANAAVALDMEVYGYDPYLSVNAAWSLSRAVHHVTNVEDIYAQCDYITIHVPLMDSTRGMLNAEAISKMKDGVMLLNFARDLLANEADVLEALEGGKVARYVSDFPNPTTAGQKGCIVIPHLNYPACDMGICTKAGRVAIFHKNIANMITKFAAKFGEKGINISDMTNKSRGEVAYTMLDVEEAPTEEIIRALEAIQGVFRVRIVKG